MPTTVTFILDYPSPYADIPLRLRRTILLRQLQEWPGQVTAVTPCQAADKRRTLNRRLFWRATQRSY